MADILPVILVVKKQKLNTMNAFLSVFVFYVQLISFKFD